MEEATKAGRAGGLGGGGVGILYADDLALMGKTEEQTIDLFNKSKKQMEKQVLEIDMEKTKVIVPGKRGEELIEGSREIPTRMLLKRSRRQLNLMRGMSAGT